MFATGELAGLVGFTTLPPVGSCPTLGEARPAPKVFSLFNWRYYKQSRGRCQAETANFLWGEIGDLSERADALSASLCPALDGPQLQPPDERATLVAP
jgi:hypothetical protein